MLVPRLSKQPFLFTLFPVNNQQFITRWINHFDRRFANIFNLQILGKINITGSNLPYYGSTFVEQECISCLETRDDGDENRQEDMEDEDEVIKFCEETYERAARCEKNMDTYYAGMIWFGLLSYYFNILYLISLLQWD